METKPKATKLTFPQTCMVANFYDVACDLSRASFEDVTRRMLQG
jgi:hypothetical protein